MAWSGSVVGQSPQWTEGEWFNPWKNRAPDWSWCCAINVWLHLLNFTLSRWRPARWSLPSVCTCVWNGWMLTCSVRLFEWSGWLEKDCRSGGKCKIQEFTKLNKWMAAFSFTTLTLMVIEKLKTKSVPDKQTQYDSCTYSHECYVSCGC